MPKLPILSRRKQMVVLGFVALAVVALFVAVTVVRNINDAPVSSETHGQAGMYRPNQDQWAALKIAPVTQMTFRTEQTTDGKIAIDDDATTQVFSPYSGRVAKLLAKSGDTVKQGDTLFTVEATEFVQAQNDLISASAALNTAKAQLKLSETTEKRQHELYDAKGGALKAWQQSQVDLESARATLRSNEIAYAATRNHLRILGKNDIEIDALENAPETQKMDAEAVVTAPIGGTVIQRQIGLGQYIQAGASNPVYTIGNLTKMWLVANVREVDTPLVKLDEAVEVHVLAYPDRVFNAKLAYIAASVDPTTHRLPVRAEVDNEDQALKPEMFAHFSIITGADSRALAVPESAVVYEGDTAHVWVAQDDKTIALRIIHAGRTNKGMVEVLEGLKAEEKIIASGALFIDRAAASD